MWWILIWGIGSIWNVGLFRLVGFICIWFCGWIGWINNGIFWILVNVWKWYLVVFISVCGKVCWSFWIEYWMVFINFWCVFWILEYGFFGFNFKVLLVVCLVRICVIVIKLLFEIDIWSGIGFGFVNYFVSDNFGIFELERWIKLFGE